MTPDTSEFETASTNSKGAGGKCKLGATLDIIREEDPDFAEKLNAALEARVRVTHTAIDVVMKRHGYPTSDTTIRKHRNGTCACQSQ